MSHAPEPLLQRHSFNVGMSCEGCKGAVTRLVQKVSNVEHVEIDLPKQQLIVAGKNVEPQQVVDVLTAWAKAKNRTLKYTGVAS